MKLFDKNGYLFITEGFFLSRLSVEKQLTPKQRINMYNKIKKDLVGGDNVGNIMLDTYAVTKSIRETYSFISSHELDETLKKAGVDSKRAKKGVGSLGMYIVEVMEIDASILNCIICFSINQADAENSVGYILIKDGTIYPDAGEFVSDINTIKESIVSLIRKHNRGTNDERYIQFLYVPSELSEIQDSIDTTADINVQILDYSSDRIFWDKKSLKSYFSKVKYRPFQKPIKKQLIGIGVVLTCLIGGYSAYSYFFQEEMPIVVAEKPKTNLIKGSDLVAACFKDTGAIFSINKAHSDYGGWYIDTFSCSSKGLSVKFRTMNAVQVPAMAVEELKNILQDKNISASNGTYIYTRKINVNIDYHFRGTAIKMFESLEVAKSKYDLEVKTLNNQSKTIEKSFELDSSLSPVYFYNNGVINDLPLTSIEGKYNLSDDSYLWKILGKVK